MTFTTLIEATTLRDLVGKPEVAILDCRFDLANPGAGRNAFLSGHIPGARYADLNRDLSAPVTAASGRHPLPSPEGLTATLKSLGIGSNTQVIAYDDSAGAFAARAWWLLRWVGHDAAAVLNGGLKAWLAGGGRLESGPAAVARAGVADPHQFIPRVDLAAVLDAASIEALLTDPAFLLVDARAPERFAGTVEPIDSVAGHVAGAVESALLSEPRCRRPLPAGVGIAAAVGRTVGGESPESVAVMCGSGVTACHDLLSLEVAGLSGAKLYPGSWSEWIRDPKRPIARGA